MTVAEGYRLAIDIGGTFTDVVLLDAATVRQKGIRSGSSLT